MAFSIQMDQARVESVTNGALVTPNYLDNSKIPPITGKLVMRGTGSPVYRQDTTGTAFLYSGWQNIDTSFYQFDGLGVGGLFDPRIASRVELRWESRYSLQDRLALQTIEGNRYIYRTAFDVADGAGTKMAKLMSTIQDGHLTFIFQHGSSAIYYFLPKGTEDIIFGREVSLNIKIIWDGHGNSELFFNDLSVGKLEYHLFNPTWTSSSTFTIGATNPSDWGGGFWASDDPIHSLTVWSAGPFEDTDPPFILSMIPAVNTSVYGISQVSAVVNDNIAVSNVQFTVDGLPVSPQLTIAPFQYTWDTRSFSDGPHTLSVTASDTASNTASKSLTVIVSNLASALIDMPPNPVTGLTTLHTETGLIQIGWDPGLDDRGVSSYEVYRNGNRLSSANTTTFQDYEIALSTPYSYQVQSIDPAGQRSPLSAPITVSVGTGRTLTVGPQGTYLKPCAAILDAAPGDAIEIDATGNGTYDGDTCGWRTAGLTIRGVNGRARIDAAGRDSGGKATWVIAGASNTVENVELSGSAVPDGNGAGIRMEAPDLLLRNVYIHHNQNGILGGPMSGSLTIEFSEFAYNGSGTGYTHNIYVGDIDVFTFRYSYSHDCRIGHLLKSRAKQTNVLFSRLTDETGTASYELDLPNGGLGYFIGNVIQQSSTSENFSMLAYGFEGLSSDRTHDLYLLNNTFVDNRGGGYFLSLASGSVRAVAQNNLFYGPGALVNDASLLTQFTNSFTDTPMFADAGSYDYRLLDGSPLLSTGSSLAALGLGFSSPVAQYDHRASGHVIAQTSTPNIGANQ